MELSPTPTDRLPWRRSTFLTALLGWVLPGLGQLYVGRPRKGLLFLLAILPTFLVGWALTDFTIVNPSKYGLDFAAQMFLGGPVLGALAATSHRALDHLPRFLDVGRLYVQVAGLLNLVAISDAIGEAIAHNVRILDLKAEQRRAQEVEARRLEVGPSGLDEMSPPSDEEASPEEAATGEEEALEPEGEPPPPDPDGRKLAEEARDWPVFGPHPVRDLSDAFDKLQAPKTPPKKPKEGGGA